VRPDSSKGGATALIDMSARVRSLPGPSWAAGSVVDDLCMGRGVVWAFPRPAPAIELITETVDRLYDAGIETHVVRVSEHVDPEGGKARQRDMPALEDTIRKVTGKAAPRELLDGKFTPVVTVFDALDICDEVAQKAVDVGMMTTLREWAVQSREDYRRTGIFAGVMLVTTGSVAAHVAPDNDCLRTRWHWGTVTVAELCLLAREIAADLKLGWERSTWMQWVGSEVAGTDPALLVHLCEQWEPAEGMSQLINVLCSYAMRQGWTAKDYASVPRNLGEPFTPGRTRRPPCPPEHLAALYDLGMLDWEAERGLRLHSAALALAGDVTEISHRVWAGQAGCLLPLFDRERLEICRRLDEESGGWRNWCARTEDRNCSGLAVFNDSGADQAVDEGTPVMEFADIRQYLSCNRNRSTAALLKRVDFLTKARNCLAHYTPLSWENFSAALKWHGSAEEFAGKG
jgi:hypothetical protein